MSHLAGCFTPHPAATNLRTCLHNVDNRIVRAQRLPLACRRSPPPAARRPRRRSLPTVQATEASDADADDDAAADDDDDEDDEGFIYVDIPAPEHLHLDDSFAAEFDPTLVADLHKYFHERFADPMSKQSDRFIWVCVFVYM